jgi:hypothetical protein
MEQNPSSEANSHSAGEISCLLWNSKIHHIVHKSPPIQRPCVTFHKKHFFLLSVVVSPSSKSILFFNSKTVTIPSPFENAEDRDVQN